MARYHGLSSLGCDMLSSMGMIMPSTNYVRMMKEVVAMAKRTARLSQTLLTHEVHVEHDSMILMITLF